ncbi:MAG: UDP-N-acetylmuramate dehydrogenase [Bacillota bacterium]
MTARVPRERLESLVKILEHADVWFDEPLWRHTSFQIGGPADLFVSVTTLPDLAAALDFCACHQVPWVLLGRGTNVLVKDGGVRAVVLTLGGELATYNFHGHSATAGGGACLGKLARAAASAGLGGLEFASGIPGSVGGAVVMNAGAYNGQLADVVSWVTVVSPGQEPRRLDRAELEFDYRWSSLQERRVVVTEVGIELRPGDPAALLATIDELDARRRSRQPLDLPSGGSTFKRPPGHYAAQLIEEAGLKGRRRGGAQVSPVHAGFIVNTGGATAQDVLVLMEEVQKAVYTTAGVMLEPEIRIIGEDPDD